MIKLLISDLDDTLYDWTGFFVPAFYAMADEIARMTGIDEKKLLNEYMAAHQRLGSVEYPYATLELPSIKAYYNNAPAEELKAALRPAFNVFNSVRESHLHLLPGVEEMLRALTEMGVTLIAYTESSKENGFYRLMKLGLEPYFKHVYTFESQFKSAYAVSEKVRTVQTKKPDVAVIGRICTGEGYDKSEVMYLGDNLTKDMYMAKMAGVTAVWMHRKCENEDYKNKLLAITSWTAAEYARDVELRQYMQQHGIRPDYEISDARELIAIAAK